jgi:hypothetical protein
VVRCAQRWPYLLDFLESTNADIIALQEVSSIQTYRGGSPYSWKSDLSLFKVTEAFLTLLLAQAWTRNYFITDIIHSPSSIHTSTVLPYGQVFLYLFTQDIHRKLRYY